MLLKVNDVRVAVDKEIVEYGNRSFYLGTVLSDSTREELACLVGLNVFRKKIVAVESFATPHQKGRTVALYTRFERLS